MAGEQQLDRRLRADAQMKMPAMADGPQRAVGCHGVHRFRLDQGAPIEWTDLIRGPQHFDPKTMSDPVVRRALSSSLRAGAERVDVSVGPSLLDLTRDVDLALWDLGADALAVIERLAVEHDPVTAEIVVDALAAGTPPVHRATVYRTLKLLTECGLAALRRFGDGQTMYETAGDTEHHDHLICLKCNLILEFANEEIEALQERVARDLGGFKVVQHKLELYGLCPKEQGVVGGSCPGEDLRQAESVRR